MTALPPCYGLIPARYQSSRFPGKPLVAIDAIGAGRNEVVLLASGSSARQTEVTLNTPCDAVIMAIVDSVEVDGKEVFRKGDEN